ncbi:MFS transporter [Francisella persica]|nr:MFS transporter [Francisella persica]
MAHFLCKSPRWLVLVGKDKEAEGVLNKIFKKNSAQRELTEI